MKLLFSSMTALTGVSASLTTGSFATAPPSSLGAWAGCLVEISSGGPGKMTLNYTANSIQYVRIVPFDPGSPPGILFVGEDGCLYELTKLT